jgi:opacity protein-like surface antigen
MKKIVQGLFGGAPLLLALAAAPAAAQEATVAQDVTAQPYTYVAGSFGVIGGDSYDNRYGVSTLETEAEQGFAGEVVWGARTGGNWRFEIGLDFRTQDVETTETSIPATYEGSIAARGLVVNAYYDFNAMHGWTPYVGLGVGAFNVTVDDGIVDDDGEGFQWQGIAGVAYDVNDRVAITIDGRYQLLGYDVSVGGADSDTVKVEGFGARLGLRYKY